MMMPPKKSKAARSDNLETNEVREKEPESDSHSEGEAETSKKVEAQSPEKTKKEHFNMFDITTVEGKRKRSSSKPEDALMDWILEHMEAKEDKKLPLGDVYNLYLEKCVSEARNAVESGLFYKAVWKEFPQGFAFKSSSPHVEVVKEVKVKKKEPKVKADTLNMKVRSIIEDSLADMGNPRGGVRFNSLLKFIAGKYPALRIEMRPKLLMTYLNRGVKYGYLTCERGIGKCGFYRRFVADEPEEEEVKEKKKDGKTKEGKEGEEAGEEKSEKEGEKDEKEGEEKDEKEKDEKKVAKKKRSAKKAPKKDRVVHHASPTHLEDTFYLAMTFMCEPKEASVLRIKKYISENYPDSKVDRLAKCLDIGKEKGYWDQVTGTSGNAGTFRLEVDSFDPTDDEDMTGMVINAIMACTEPKMCSANLLKKFVLDWHSEKFKIAERPFLFKKALERSVAANNLRQLSGIGASGTFQLVKPFCPSPVVLAGQDTLSDYEDQEESETSEDEGGLAYDYSAYGDKYVPRPSKRRGKARTQAVCAKPAVEIGEQRGKKKKRKIARMAVGRKRYAESDSSEEESSSEEEEESSEEEPEPVKKKRSTSSKKAKPAKAKAKAKSTPSKRVRGRAARADSESDESESEDEAPAKSNKSRGRNSTSDNSKRKSGGGRKRPNYQEDSSSEEEEKDKVVDGYRPTPSRSRGGTSARPVEDTPKKTPKKAAPKRSKREEPAPKVPTAAAKKQGMPKYVESDSEDESPRVSRGSVQTPAAKKQGSRPAPKSRSRRK